MARSVSKVQRLSVGIVRYSLGLRKAIRFLGRVEKRPLSGDELDRGHGQRKSFRLMAHVFRHSLPSPQRPQSIALIHLRARPERSAATIVSSRVRLPTRFDQRKVFCDHRNAPYQDRARRYKKAQTKARPNQRWPLELFRAMSTIPHKEAKPTLPKMIQMIQGW
jgi:hypothetical protein